MQSTQSMKNTNQLIKEARQRLSEYDNYSEFDQLTVYDREFFVTESGESIAINATVENGMEQKVVQRLDKMTFFGLHSIVRRVGIVRTDSNKSDDENSAYICRFVFNRPTLRRKLNTWKRTREVTMLSETLQINYHEDCPQYVTVDVCLIVANSHCLDFKGNLVSVA